MTEAFLNDRVTLHLGNCLDVLARLEECSVDSCVTDPPYHLTSIVQRFGAQNAAPVKAGAYARATAGFMGKVWDGGAIAFDPATWRAVYRVLKPGAHLIAMGGTRTFHRLACAIEDAGFEIRDTISWLYGSGFPKSHDVSKGIDRAAGMRGTFGEAKSARHQGYIDTGTMRGDEGHDGWQRPWMDDPEAVANAGRRYIPDTDAAREWAGWGTALKPACELIVLARKPLSEKTVAANVLRWGTGAINVDGCRVEGRDSEQTQGGYNGSHVEIAGVRNGGKVYPASLGRWPANVAHDGSDEVTAAFPESNSARASGNPNNPWHGTNHDPTSYGKGDGTESHDYRDSGSAARFFYTAKADADDRLGSKHPTVKPLDLMQWLVRLVTPKGGTVLDPFAGTGTTGEAAWREDMRAVLIEAEPDYQTDIRRRMALVLAGPDERSRESIKAKNLPVDYGPLFNLPERDAGRTA